MKYLKTFENKFQDNALDNLLKTKDFNKLMDIDKLALLGGSNDDRLKTLNLSKIFKENGGTFGRLEIKVKIKDIKDQQIEHKFSKEFAGREGWLFPYIHISGGEGYVTVRIDNSFTKNDTLKGGGSYEEIPIFLKNMYPIDYTNIKSEFVEYDKQIEKDRENFLNKFKGLSDD